MNSIVWYDNDLRKIRGMTPEPGSFEQRWRSRFTDFASSHEDDAGIAGWTPTGLAARVRRFSQVWPGDREGALWLDAGCGAGTYVRLLRDRGVNAMGLDYSAVSVLKARERSPQSSGWLVGDATALPVQARALDGILCFGVTQALSTSERAVRQLTAVVKPGGQVWVDGLNSWCLPHLFERLARRLRGRPAHVRYESPYRLRVLMTETGLEHVRIHWLPILPGRLQRFQWLLENPLARWLLRYAPGVGALFSHSMIVSGRVPRS